MEALAWLCAQAILELFIAMYIADLVSGLVHLTFDNCVVANVELRNQVFYTPKEAAEFMATSEIFKKATGFDKFLWDFQNHHEAPFPATKSHFGMWLEIFTFEIPVFIILFGVLYFDLAPGWVVRPVIMAFALGSFMQVIHFNAHIRNRDLPLSPITRLLQDTGFLLHPSFHRKHHETFDCNYCLFNGWASPIVERVARYCRTVGIHSDTPPTHFYRSERVGVVLEGGNAPIGSLLGSSKEDVPCDEKCEQTVTSDSTIDSSDGQTFFPPVAPNH